MGGREPGDDIDLMKWTGFFERTGGVDRQGGDAGVARNPVLELDSGCWGNRLEERGAMEDLGMELSPAREAWELLHMRSPPLDMELEFSLGMEPGYVLRVELEFPLDMELG